MRRALRLLLGVGVLIMPIGLIAQNPSSGQSACDPHYPGQCIPSPPPDLNCPDVQFRDFPVLHPNNVADPHGFDSDRDGTGCEGTAGKQPFVATTTSMTMVSTIPSSTLPPATTTTAPSTVPTIPSTVPTATLSGASGEVTGELGSFGWPQPDGTMVARIVDYFFEGPNPAQALSVTQAEAVTLRFEPALPVATLTVGVWPSGPNNPSLSVPAANPSRFAVTLVPGTHVISVQATFQGVPDGRASYHFKLRVIAPAPAQPTQGRSLALTG